MAAWTDLGQGVRVRQSTCYAMNSVALLHAEQVVLVDPGVLPAEIDDIAAAVAAEKPDAIALVLTHAHWDHVIGQPWWPEATTFAHDRFAADLEKGKAHVIEEMERVATEAGQRFTRPFAPFRPTQAVSGLHFRKLGPWRLVFRSAPGHARDMLTVHLPEHGILIAADILSAIEIPALSQPPAVYRSTLEDLVVLVEGGAVETLIPGHGPIAEGRDAIRARLQDDIGYLDALDRGVRDQLARGAPPDQIAAAIRFTHAGGATEYSKEMHPKNVKLVLREGQPQARPLRGS